GAQFAVVVSNSAGSATSNLAILTVNSSTVAPSVTTQPTSQTIIAGQSATFSVTASGTSPLTYQWQKNGASISGANASSYTTPAETTADNGAQFAVVVSNSAGTVTSNSVTLTVNAATQLISASPSSLGFGNVNTGSNSVLPVVLTNSGNSNVTISSVSVSGAGFSASGISAGQIIAPTKAATLNVTFAPAATGSVTGSVSVLSNASNSPATIGLSGAGVAPVTYSISGTLSGAGGAGATVSLSGSSTATTLASASGSYSFTVLNGSYTVTPSNAGYSFSPASQPATVNNGNVSNINFTASTASGTCATSTTAGWCQVPNINMANLFQPFSGQQGNTNSLDSTLNGNVINAWSGAALNPSTNTMILWGGGHTDYNGNEVYEVNFGANPITMTRATNPTPNPNGSGSSTSCPAAAVTGIPNGRHTYNGLVYVPSISRMMAINGAIACSSGAGAVPPDEWLFNDNNNGWSQINYSGTEPGHVNSTNYQVGNVLLYDSNSDKVYASDHCFDYSTVPGTWAWTELDNTCTNSTEMAGVIDPQRKKYILFGDSANSAGYYEADLGTGVAFNLTTPTLTGCSGPEAAQAPGIAWDANRNRAIIWDGDGHVYDLDPDTHACTQLSTSLVPASPNPGAQNPQGTFGRFQALPNLGDGNRFALVNNNYIDPVSGTANAAAKTTAWVLNVPLETNNWSARSTASGVVQALKLQSATEISNAGGGINGDSSCSVSFDSAVPVDGGGNSALFSIIQNPTTDLYCSITVPLAQQFGEGSDFYYQWQEYWDSNFLANSTGTGPYVNGANGGEGLKHVLLWANTSASGCSSIELMHVDQYGRGYPQINTDCGSYQLCIQHSGNNACLLSSSNIPAGDNLYEQGNNLPTSPLGPSGDVSYNCYANLTNLTNGCAMWKAGVWMTFYCHQHTGTWGTNNGPGGGGDLTTKCWFALPGQSM